MLEYLASGMTEREIIDDFSYLTQQDILKYNSELPQLTKSDFSDYLHNLEAYEEKLARG